jgi:catalase
MNGYSSHTYSWQNAEGKVVWVKYHWKTEQGIQNFTNAEAKAMRAEDPDYHRRDLWGAITRKDYPAWRLEVQIMPLEDAAGYRFNPFDLTKVWPHTDYPPITVGRFVLDHNPTNYFAEIEQAAFNPSNLVPGTGLSPDKMLQARAFSYADTHRYRIGTNYQQLPVNRPRVEVHSYSKDGSMRYAYTPGQPVYAPNSFGGPQADPSQGADVGWWVEAGEILRTAYMVHREDDDFVQPRMLYQRVMTPTDREHLVSNVVDHLSQGVPRTIQERAIRDYWAKVDPELGVRVASGLGLEVGPSAPQLSSAVG